MRLAPAQKLILTFLLALGATYYYFGLLLPSSRRQNELKEMSTRYAWGGDFYPIWLTSRSLFTVHRDPYTPEMTRQIQIGLYGRPMNRPIDPSPDYRAFSYPLYTDLLSAPLLPLPFENVRLILSALLLLLTGLSVVFWLNALRIKLPPPTIAIFVVLTLVSYPALEGLYAIQAGMFVATGLACSVWVFSRNHFWLAGILLALATIKPQMVWPLALFFILWSFRDWRSRKGTVLGFFLTIAVLFTASWIILPGWFSGWWHALTTYSGYTLPPLPQLLFGKAVGSVLYLALIAFVGTICWNRIQHPGSPDFSLCVDLVLSLTALLLPTGGAVYDQIILLPAFLWLWSRRDEIRSSALPLRVLALATAIALFWQWIAACAVAVISLLSPIWANSPSLLVLPLRLAASLPFAVFALLAIFAAQSLQKDANQTSST